MAISATVAVVAAGCGEGAHRLTLGLRGPDDPGLLDGVDTFVLSVEDAERRPLVLRRFPAGPGPLELGGVPFGSRLTFQLEGLYREAPLVRGRSCPVDVIDDREFPELSILMTRVGSFARLVDAPPGRVGAAAFAVDDAVVEAGGQDGAGQARADGTRFDVRTGAWTAEVGLPVGRSGSQAVGLGAGQALVIGGAAADGRGVDVPLLYRRGQGFSALATVEGSGRIGHRASLLPDARVLISGGAASAAGSPAVAAAVTFDGRDFRTVGSMAEARRDHTITPVGSGAYAAAFVIGGRGADGAARASIELFDPRGAGGGAFSLEKVALGAARAEHSATSLAGGEILIVGGAGDGDVLASAEIFDPTTRTVRPAGTLQRGRRGHVATLLADGRVLVTGGRGTDGQALASAEIFDPLTATFAAARSMVAARAEHAVFALCDGTVLVLGGGAAAEIYGPPR